MATKQEVARAKMVNLIDLVIETGMRYRRGFNMIQVLCPFHEEGTASMTIYEHSYFGYCCQEHGDTIAWVQKVHNASFKDAVDILNIIADKQGIE